MANTRITLVVHLDQGPRQWVVEGEYDSTLTLIEILQAILQRESINVPLEMCQVIVRGIRVNALAQLTQWASEETVPLIVYLHIPGEKELRILRDLAAQRDSDFELSLDTDDDAPAEPIAPDDALDTLNMTLDADEAKFGADSAVEVIESHLTTFESETTSDSEESDRAAPQGPAAPPPALEPPPMMRQRVAAPAPTVASAPAPSMAPPEPLRPAPSGQVMYKKSVKAQIEPVVTKHVTIRYYERMNPARVFPLLVVLSSAAIAKVIQKHVGQQASGPVQVETDRTLEIEPVLPGCTCYPPKAALLPTAADQTVNFWVVPDVLGNIPGALVRVTQGGKIIAEVPIQVRVTQQTATVLAGVTTMALPLASALAKHFRLDLESQLQDGFSIYLTILNTLMKLVPTPALFGGLAAITLILYLMRRPKKRDLFFDIQPEK